MNKYLVLGIDPGLSGGLARLTNTKDAWNDVWEFPVEKKKVGKNKSGTDKIRRHFEKQSLATLLTFASSSIHCEVYPNVFMELVHSKPNDGRVQAYSFGHTSGLLEGMCIGLGLRVHFVSPQKWKRHFGLIGCDKEASRQKAIKLFPEMADKLKRKKDEGLAEALLIAEYGRQSLEENGAV